MVRRWPVVAVTWALGTSTGVLLGLFGVNLVASGITDSLVSPLSRPEVLRALQAETTPAPEPAPPVPHLPPSPLPDPGAVPPLTTPVSPPAPTPPISSPPRPGAVAGTTTTTASPPPTTAPPATAPPASPSAPKPGPSTGVTRTITSAGGTVAVRYEAGRVRLLWARPNDGFNVEVRSDGPEAVEVEFRGKGHRSLVRAFYEDGAPAQDVVEQGRPPGRGDGKDG